MNVENECVDLENVLEASNEFGTVHGAEAAFGFLYAGISAHVEKLQCESCDINNEEESEYDCVPCDVEHAPEDKPDLNDITLPPLLDCEIELGEAKNTPVEDVDGCSCTTDIVEEE